METKEIAFIGVVALGVYAFVRWKRSSKEQFSDEKKQATVVPTTPSVYDAGVRSILQNMLDTQFYSMVVEPHAQNCATLDASTCTKYGAGCEYRKGKCTSAPLTSHSGWRIVNMGPGNVAFSGDFIDVEPIVDGQPILWKPGMVIRWTGKTSTGQEGIDGDFTIDKILLMGLNRRIYYKRPAMSDVAVNYWGRPEVMLVASK